MHSGRGLSEDNLVFLAQKAFTGSSNNPDDYRTMTISWAQFNRVRPMHCSSHGQPVSMALLRARQRHSPPLSSKHQIRDSVLEECCSLLQFHTHLYNLCWGALKLCGFWWPNTLLRPIMLVFPFQSLFTFLPGWGADWPLEKTNIFSSFTHSHNTHPQCHKTMVKSWLGCLTSSHSFYLSHCNSSYDTGMSPILPETVYLICTGELAWTQLHLLAMVWWSCGAHEETSQASLEWWVMIHADLFYLNFFDRYQCLSEMIGTHILSHFNISQTQKPVWYVNIHICMSILFAGLSWAL